MPFEAIAETFTATFCSSFIKIISCIIFEKFQAIGVKLLHKKLVTCKCEKLVCVNKSNARITQSDLSVLSYYDSLQAFCIMIHFIRPLVAVTLDTLQELQ